MKEADGNTKINLQESTPDISEITNEEDSQEAKQQKALRELFLILEEDAKRENKPVNGAIRAVPMLITTIDETESYILRINPAIVSNGKLNVAVLDLYYNESYHLQQWVIKAEWTDEKPKITGLDDSMIKEGIKPFMLTEIAEYATKILRGGIGKTDALDTTPGLTIIMPPEYSNGIN